MLGVESVTVISVYAPAVPAVPFCVNRRTGRAIDVLYDEESNTVQAHIIPQ